MSKKKSTISKDEFKDILTEFLKDYAESEGFQLNMRSMFISDAQITFSCSIFGDVKEYMSQFEINYEPENDYNPIKLEKKKEVDGLEVLSEEDVRRLTS